MVNVGLRVCYVCVMFAWVGGWAMAHLLEMRETRARVASCSRTLGFVQRSRETGSSSQEILLIVANFVRGGHGSAR